MRYILFIIMMIQGILCHAAICKHVSGGTETDNRSVLKIQKDLCGYMWFLTYDGINRYDGTHLKRYDLNWGNDSVRSCLYSYNLCTDSKNELWLFSEDGNIWLYNRLCDRFEKYIDLKEKVRGTFSFLCMDDGDNAWLGSNKELYIFLFADRKVTSDAACFWKYFRITICGRREILFSFRNRSLFFCLFR